jgi:hypothetical protein
MKKFAPIAALALFAALSMTSCKKKYTCECTYPSNPTLNTSIQTEKMKKSDAEARCALLNTVAATAPDPGSCKLK